MPTARCGYVADVRGNPSAGRTCCWRRTVEGADRCIWHLPAAEKSATELPPLSPRDRVDGAVLRTMSLDGVDWLADSVVLGADFSDATVRNADLSGADLRESTFDNVDARNADFSGANLEDATVTATNLRGADLTHARIDAVEFDASRINGATRFGDRNVYEVEMDAEVGPVPKEEALDTAVRVYRDLEALSQENTLYDQASRYYRKSKDVRRRYHWDQRNLANAILAEASRWTAGYGNEPWQVIETSTAVVLGSALLYPLLGGVRVRTDEGVVVMSAGTVDAVTIPALVEVFLTSLYFSVVTFTTLGYGTIEPASRTGQFVASAEAILGAILMALLVAVLTRSAWLR